MLKRVTLAVFTLVVLTSSCVAPIPTPSSRKTWTVENAGWICFREYDLSTRELRGTFRPKGCFSSSCTVPQEQQVDVQFDNDQAMLKFVTKFVLLDTSVRTPPKVCTADCAGGGEVTFKFADIVTGTYTVILGDQTMGSLDVPPVFSETAGICFSELH